MNASISKSGMLVPPSNPTNIEQSGADIARCGVSDRTCPFRKSPTPKINIRPVSRFPRKLPSAAARLCIFNNLQKPE